MANDNTEFLTLRILDTPAGQEVANTFLATLFQTWDIGQSTERARQVAENNGTLKVLGFSAFIDFLTKIAPILIRLGKSKSR